jgi:hypothetical protein
VKKYPWAYLAAVLLVGLFFAQAVGNLSAQSPVVDEPSHIARAMAYWRVGDLRLQIGHPPLIHALAGLPLLLEPGVPQLTSLPGWEPLEREKLNGHALWGEGRPTDRIVFLTRWPVLMLALLLGALIFRWAGERFGIRAAFLALFLFAFDPNLLAHSALITTDLGVTFFILLAVYSFDRWARHPSRTWLVICGVTFGLAMTAKFTAVILVPVLIGLALVAGWHTRRIAPTLAALAAMFLIGVVVVWAVYRFEVGPFQPLPVNIPASRFLDGLLRVKERDDEGRMAFLLGQMSPRGWWYYFPIAFAVKTPLPTLLLLGVALVGGGVSTYRLARQGNSEERWERVWTALVLLLLPVAYFAVSMTSSQDLGYRYILPVLPFLFIAISEIGNWRLEIGYRVTLSPSQAKLGRHLVTLSPYFLVSVLFVWYMVGTAVIFPYHLAYFNEVAGGPDNGYKILVDSNLDWGQDVKRLKTWMDAHQIGQVRLSATSGSLPERYGIRVLPLPGVYQSANEYGFRRFAPEPGVYVISASNWQGLRFHNPDTFDWFRHQQPIARIGHSLFVYNVPPSPEVGNWVAVCYAPDGPIDGNGLAAGFGRTDMRSIFFDCRSAWVYLHDSGPGYYVIPARGDPTIAQEMLLGHATAIYHDRGDPTQPKDNPGFTLYRWDGTAEVNAKLAGLVKPPNGAFDFGPASLVGYEVEHGPLTPGGDVHLTTWWHVNSPGEAALSAYVHVTSGERSVSVGGDGLYVPPPMWQPGDVIVQQHVLKLLSDLAPGDYTLHVGLYSTETGKRYPLQVNGQAGDDYPPLATLQVVSK